jgi:hypothetical protein
MKTCIVCGEEKAEEEFYPLSGKYKDTGRTMNRCKACHNAACVECQRLPEAKDRIAIWKRTIRKECASLTASILSSGDCAIRRNTES